MGSTADQGALSQLYLATSPDVEVRDVRGRYFVPVAKEAAPGEFYVRVFFFESKGVGIFSRSSFVRPPID